MEKGCLDERERERERERESGGEGFVSSIKLSLCLACRYVAYLCVISFISFPLTFMVFYIYCSIVYLYCLHHLLVFLVHIVCE